MHVVRRLVLSKVRGAVSAQHLSKKGWIHVAFCPRKPTAMALSHHPFESSEYLFPV